MTIALTSARTHASDTSADVMMIGINYDSSRVIVRVRFTNGETEDITFEGAALVTLRSAVSQFSGLRLALEQYLAANRPELGGVAS